MSRAAAELARMRSHVQELVGQASAKASQQADELAQLRSRVQALDYNAVSIMRHAV